MPKSRKPKPFVIKTPYSSMEKTRKKLGASKKDLRKMEKVVEEVIANDKRPKGQRTVQVELVVLTGKESEKLAKLFRKLKPELDKLRKRSPKKPRKRPLRSGKRI